MMQLESSLRAWGTSGFETALKREIAQHASSLPLQQGLSTGNYVADTPISVTIIRLAELQCGICVQAGIFFQSVISGCSCADDPTPASEINEYCEFRIDIDKITAETSISLAR